MGAVLGAAAEKGIPPRVSSSLMAPAGAWTESQLPHIISGCNHDVESTASAPRCGCGEGCSQGLGRLPIARTSSPPPKAPTHPCGAPLELLSSQGVPSTVIHAAILDSPIATDTSDAAEFKYAALKRLYVNMRTQVRCEVGSTMAPVAEQVS